MVKRDLIRNIILVAIALLTFFLLRIFVFSTFKVHEDASNAYLKNGDVVLVNRNKKPQYKDFIVYKVKDTFYISRIIATEGQEATVMDDILYLDKAVKDEPYIESEKVKYLTSADSQTAFTSDFSVPSLTNNKYTTVPKGYYLVLNDNRQNTNDSRRFGLIKESQIQGAISFRLLPLKEFGFLNVE